MQRVSTTLVAHTDAEQRPKSAACSPSTTPLERETGATRRSV
tara:strand:- start:1004 stop:1129 length:126 start_codon:yes stop_codon:yes gene_type:complete